MVLICVIEQAKLLAVGPDSVIINLLYNRGPRGSKFISMILNVFLMFQHAMISSRNKWSRVLLEPVKTGHFIYGYSYCVSRNYFEVLIT